MALMDTHCHLDFDAFELGREALLSECQKNEIEAIVVPGVTCNTWSHCLSLGERFDLVRVALGLHPYFIEEHTEHHLLELDRYLTARHPSIVAVGEIGLDDTCANFSKQCEFFEAQLDLAVKYGLPVSMHMRRNHGHGLKRVRQRQLVGGVVHAFSGSFQDGMAWVELGLKIGVGGIITYSRAKKTRQTIARLPLSSLVLETDAPDMSMQGIPKGEGTPLMLAEILAALVELRPEPRGELIEALWANSCELFSLES